MHPSVALLIGAALANALYQLLTRRLLDENPHTTLFYSASVGTVVLSIALPFAVDVGPLSALAISLFVLMAGVFTRPALVDDGALLVSHSVGPISGLQKRLFAELRARFPSLEPHWLVQFRSQPRTTRIMREAQGRKLFWRTNDHLQRLRSIFFFSVAGIIAQAIDVKEIFMCENGLIGAAIVFSSRDDNPSTTRPAEPHYLRSMESFLRQALEFEGLQIRNPFQYMTKGEVLTLASNLGLRSALYQTVSCWRSGNRGVRNCGQCVPCLFRQLAFDEADFPPPPQKYKYQHPIPKRNWRRWNSSELERLEDIRQYCQTAVEEGTRWFFENEFAVVDAIDVTHGPTRKRKGRASDQDVLDNQAPRKMAQVILRFAEATLERLP